MASITDPREKISIDDRRRYTRFAGDGLLARWTTRIVPVVDVSFGGLRLGFAAGMDDVVETDITLIPLDFEIMQLGQAATGRVRVLGCRAAGCRFSFADVSPGLVRLIGDHIRRQKNRPMFLNDVNFAPLSG